LIGILIQGQKKIKYSSKNKNSKSTPKLLKQVHQKTKHILVLKLKVPTNYETIKTYSQKEKEKNKN
jgi:hypothetical protein